VAAPDGDDSPAAILTNDHIVDAAALKRTSLYDIAIRAGISDPRNFVRHFIAVDRQMRATGGLS
jgi:energy-coupling factor transport system ATP-binding protein